MMFTGKILLASQSPRRREILSLAGCNFRVISADVDETYYDDVPVRAFPEYLASKKANAVSAKAEQEEIIIAADTIVLKEEKIYGKPTDRADAIRILTELSGARHDVITGVCLLAHGKENTFSELTKVYFNALTAEQITFYVDTFKPFDKAGAYAIQEWIGVIGIRKIEGCYFNVMGLPMSRVWEELQKFA